MLYSRLTRNKSVSCPEALVSFLRTYVSCLDDRNPSADDEALEATMVMSAFPYTEAIIADSRSQSSGSSWIIHNESIQRYRMPRSLCNLDSIGKRVLEAKKV